MTKFGALLGYCIVWSTVLIAVIVPFEQGRSIPATPLTPHLAVAAQITTNPNEPAPYPEGVFCTPKGDTVLGVETGLHPCACHMVMRESPDGCCDILQANDPVCRQYCTEKHCACPRECVKS